LDISNSRVSKFECFVDDKHLMYVAEVLKVPPRSYSSAEKRPGV